MTSDIDGQMSFKFYDSGKFDVYESAAKIQLSTGGETFTAYNQEDAYRVIKDAYDAKGKQLIQYTLKDNKVNKLIFAEETSVSNDDRFQLNKTLKQADYTVYREYIYEKDASADSMEYIRWLPRAGYVYIVSNTEKNCNYGLFNNVYNAMGNNYTISKEYEISAYNVSEVGYAEYTVVKEREGTAGSEVMPDVNWQNSDIAIISDKEIVVDDSGEPTVSFTAFACDSQSQGAKTIKLRARESDLRNSEKADNTDGTIPSFGEGQTNIYEQNTINFNDLRPGDVIRYTMDSLTQTVSGFALVCAKEHLTSNWACKSYTGANWIGVTTGTVVAKSDLGVKIYGSHINSGIYGNYLTSARCEYTNRDLVVVYNTKDETMKMGSWDDIQEDAKLWHYRDGTYTWGGSVWMIFE